MIKILIIDDEEIIRKRLKKLLSLDGFDANIAENGQQGIEIYREILPNIVLLDIKMPGLDGIEVLKLINNDEHSKNSEVIMITGHGGIDTAIEAMKEGAFAYIQKPIQYDELQIEINKALEKIRMQNELDEYVIKLRNSVLEWETTFNAMTHMISILNTDLKINRVNKAFATKLDYPIEAIPGNYLNEFFLDSYPEYQNGIFDKVLELKEAVTQELQFSNIPGFFDVSVNPLFDENKNISGFIHIINDITRRKEYEEERRIMEVKAFTHSKLATIGELASGMAHEINQPLSYITATLYLIKESIQENDYDKEQILSLLDNSIRQGDRVSDLIQHMKIYSRTETPKDIVDLNNVLSNSMIFYEKQLEINNIKLNLQIDDSIPGFSGYETRLEQIFINLFQNAMDAFSQDENNTNKEIKIEIKYIENKQNICFCFSDNGPGIKSEILNKIFEPFYTTKSAGQGTGLGLSIVYGIVTEHNGTIECESQTGIGTKFIINLPVQK